ncbi:MAG: ribosomal-processing cysteine protease Prp [Clostridiales bacterium]|nr:ribosomal-processing cysteine protease Prp [Clostridiales bacterium]
MTIIELYYNEDKKICKVKASGHSNFKSGDDIVCASVSSITQTALLGLINVVNLAIDYVVEDGFLSFEIPDNLTYEEDLKVDAILSTMREGLLDIQSGYSKFVKLEEKYNVY